MKITKNLNWILSVVVILTITLMLAGCSQPQKKADPSPTVPESQPHMMGQTDPSPITRNDAESMQKDMSLPENRQSMINMMSSSQMRPTMVDMMQDPVMLKAMTDIMAEPAMKSTFQAMVKDRRLAPIAQEALKQ